MGKEVRFLGKRSVFYQKSLYIVCVLGNNFVSRFQDKYDPNYAEKTTTLSPFIDTNNKRSVLGPIIFMVSKMVSKGLYELYSNEN